MFFCIVLLFYGIYPDLNKMNDWILAQIMQLKQKKLDTTLPILTEDSYLQITLAVHLVKHSIPTASP